MYGFCLLLQESSANTANRALSSENRLKCFQMILKSSDMFSDVFSDDFSDVFSDDFSIVNQDKNKNHLKNHLKI
jgi:hypothetical protein